MAQKRRRRANVPGELDNVNQLAMTHLKQDEPTIPMQDLLGEKLRAYYNEVVSEPVPDRFDQLLKELDARSNSQKSS